MDETPQIFESKKLDMRFIATGVCFVLFGAVLGYFLHFYVAQPQVASQDKFFHEGDQQIPRTESINKEPEFEKNSESASQENPTLYALQELIKNIPPTATPSGLKFVTGYGATRVIMDYPDTFRISKVGSPDPYTINYGQEDFDSTKDSYYKVEDVSTNGELQAQIRVNKPSRIYGFEDDSFIYEPYSDKFYSLSSSDRGKPVIPQSVGTTGDGQNIYQFTYNYGGLSGYKYLIIERDLDRDAVVVVEVEHYSGISEVIQDGETYKKAKENFISTLEKMLETINFEEVDTIG